MTVKFLNVVLKKDREAQLDQWCKKWSITKSQGQEYPTNNKQKEGRIGHILRRNGLLKHDTEGKIKGRIDVSGRQERRRTQLLNDLKEKREYCKLKQEALDRTLWRTRLEEAIDLLQDRLQKERNEMYNIKIRSEINIIYLLRSRHSSVDIVTRLRAGYPRNRDSFPGGGKRFIYSLNKRRDRR